MLCAFFSAVLIAVTIHPGTRFARCSASLRFAGSGTLLWDLPLELPGDRAHDAGEQESRHAPLARRHHGHLRVGRPLVALRRRADPARRHAESRTADTQSGDERAQA